MIPLYYYRLLLPESVRYYEYSHSTIRRRRPQNPLHVSLWFAALEKRSIAEQIHLIRGVIRDVSPEGRNALFRSFAYTSWLARHAVEINDYTYPRE